MKAVKKEVPVLFDKKADCCACGACLNICHQNAISMREDACGFVYPEIDQKKCIGCGLCKKVCAFQNTDVANTPVATGVAVAKDRKIRMRSASGGIFAELAGRILQEGGLVCGAAFQRDWSVAHVLIDNMEQLSALQGSKYVYSSTEKTYSQTEKALKDGRTVLYSGTPCQIAGLYGYLRQDYVNLITVDIVCHGVPGARMFRDYIRQLEEKCSGKVKMFSFRDKTLGWGINGSADIEKAGAQKKVKIWRSASSYLHYFTQGEIYRENCYSCKYACANRPADLTLGDFWGIEKEHPEYLDKDGWNEKYGISLVIASTEKGVAVLQTYGSGLEQKTSTFEAAQAGNGQLKRPAAAGNRDEIMQLYAQQGYPAVEQRFQKRMGIRKYSSQVKALIPAEIKRVLKRMR